MHTDGAGRRPHTDAGHPRTVHTDPHVTRLIQLPAAAVACRAPASGRWERTCSAPVSLDSSPADCTPAAVRSPTATRARAARTAAGSPRPARVQVRGTRTRPSRAPPSARLSRESRTSASVHESACSPSPDAEGAGFRRVVPVVTSCRAVPARGRGRPVGSQRPARISDADRPCVSAEVPRAAAAAMRVARCQQCRDAPCPQPYAGGRNTSAYRTGTGHRSVADRRGRTQTGRWATEPARSAARHTCQHPALGPQTSAYCP